MAYSVGLTGSIASGKSTVGQYFLKLGCDLISSDIIARSLTDRGQPALESIAEHFGKRILHENGELNRALLRETIFEHPEERLWLEQLLHPLIRSTLKLKAEQSKSPYCLVEIPLLYQRKDYPWLDRILVVTTPENIALSRIIERDQCTIEQAKAILEVQNSQVNYLELADDLLINDGDLESLMDKVLKLHDFFLKQKSCKRSG